MHFINKNSFYRNNSLNGDANEEIVIPELFLIRFAAAFRVNSDKIVEISCDRDRLRSKITLQIKGKRDLAKIFFIEKQKKTKDNFQN